MPERDLSDGLSQYADHFSPLIGDQRTGETFTEILRGIIGAETLCCSQIAASSPKLADKDYSEKRVRQFAKGETTKRSSINEEVLSGKLRERSVEHLQEEEGKPWIVWDMSSLRKESAREMEDLMEVRDGEGNPADGYKMLVGLGIKEGQRAVLHHRVFSSSEEGFRSETAEVKEAIDKAEDGLKSGAVHIMDRGFDNKKIWGEIWDRHHRLVCRIHHLDRKVFRKDSGGGSFSGKLSSGKLSSGRSAPDDRQDVSETTLEKCLGELEEQAKVQTEMKIDQRLREVWATISSVKVKVPYRKSGEQPSSKQPSSKQARKTCWLVKIEVEEKEAPWYLLTDIPVVGEASALEVFRMYRQRWSVEESFRFVKQTLGIEEVQLLALEGVRVLVSMGWIAASYLYELGIGWEEPEVRLLAKLGGWEPRSDRSPGKETLSRGLSRLLEALAVNRVLGTHRKEHGGLPPRIEAFLEGG